MHISAARSYCNKAIYPSICLSCLFYKLSRHLTFSTCSTLISLMVEIVLLLNSGKNSRRFCCIEGS